MNHISLNFRTWYIDVQAQNAKQESIYSSNIQFRYQIYKNPYIFGILSLINHVSKVRGYKQIAKRFPHEVVDVEPVLLVLLSLSHENDASYQYNLSITDILTTSSTTSSSISLASVSSSSATLSMSSTSSSSSAIYWEVKYILFIWMSILMLVPFDLHTIDSSRGEVSKKALEEDDDECVLSLDEPYLGVSRVQVETVLSNRGLIYRLVHICLQQFHESSNVRLASCLCLGRLLSRGDLDPVLIAGFCSWALLLLEKTLTKRRFENETIASLHEEQMQVLSMYFPDASLFLEESKEQFLMLSLLHTMVELATHGQRSQLQDILCGVYVRLNTLVHSNSEGTVQSSHYFHPKFLASPALRHMFIKLTVRICYLILPPRVVAWRYERGSRNLLNNLSSAGVAEATKRLGGEDGSSISSAANGPLDPSTDDHDTENANDSSFQLSPLLEDLVDALLTGLRDASTGARWACAKGIGRITARLPMEYADDVVEAVISFLGPFETETSWHGGCLAIAELARRGLLLPATRLPQAIPQILKALVYDIRRGATSIGSNVRDAACLCCWSFARAYSPQLMRPFVEQISTALLTTALFDREINCRRAASAAYQENVGRQGHENFPNGIMILNVADYFALGSRVYAYTQAAPRISIFQNYRRAFQEHLLGTKLFHWDRQVRELAAKSFASLAVFDPAWIVDVALPTLLGRATSPDVFLRHGALLGIAELVSVLGPPIFLLEKKAKEGEEMTSQGVAVMEDDTSPSTSVILTLALQDQLRNLVVVVEKARGYTGKGGEHVRSAICRILSNLCSSKIPLGQKAALRMLQTVDECLRHPSSSVQARAVSALRSLCTRCFSPSERGRCLFPDQALLDRLPLSYCKKLRDEENPAAKRGICLALGALPRPLLLAPQASDQSILDTVLEALIVASRLEKAFANRDPETRKFAVRALGQVVQTVGVDVEGVEKARDDATPSCQVCSSRGLSPAQFQRVVKALLWATHDYAVDPRGDVGSWVREAAYTSIEQCFLMLNYACSWGKSPESAWTSFLPSSLELETVNAFLRASVEKLDSLRGLAGETLSRMLHFDSFTYSEYLAAMRALERKRERSVLPSTTITACGSFFFTSQLFEATDGRLKVPLHVPHLRSLREVFEKPELVVVSTEDKEEVEVNDMIEDEDGPVADEAGKDPNEPVAASASDPEFSSDLLDESNRDRIAVKSDINWSVPALTMPRIVPLLAFDEFALDLIEGLCTSIGGMSESVTKTAGASLGRYIKSKRSEGANEAEKQESMRILKLLMQLLRAKKKQPWDYYVDPKRPNGGTGIDGMPIEPSTDPVGGGAAPTASALTTSAIDSASTDPQVELSKWFQTILGTSSSLSMSTILGSNDSNSKVDSRLVYPSMKTIELLLTTLPCSNIDNAELCIQCMTLVRRRLETSKDDIQRFLVASSIFVAFLQSHLPIVVECAMKLSLELCSHPFPKVRSSTSCTMMLKLPHVMKTLSANEDEEAVTARSSQAWSVCINTRWENEDLTHAKTAVSELVRLLQWTDRVSE
jgi:Tubulin folding cofactor D C terminal